MISELSQPHNWCDSRCDRCRLADECPIPGAPYESVLAAAQDAVRMLEEILREQGIDPDTVGPAPPPPLDAQILRDAAFAWFTSLQKLGAFDGRVSLVVAKVARIAEHPVEGDAEPNLLLIERTLDELRPEHERLRGRAGYDLFDERDRVLRGLLEPLIAAVPAIDRRVIAALAAAGRAPSPFAVKPGDAHLPRDQ